MLVALLTGFHMLFVTGVIATAIGIFSHDVYHLDRGIRIACMDVHAMHVQNCHAFHG